MVIVGRSPAKTAAVAHELGAPFHIADFADLSQVRSLAAELDAAYPRIDVLANNAGGIMGKRTLTTDGFETTFQVNHLAVFLLTNLLLAKLTASQAKVIQTASVAGRAFSAFDIDDLQNAAGYSPEKAYGNGKLENIMFTRELQRRCGDRGLAAAAFHPGIVASNFASETTHVMRIVYHLPLISRLVMTSPNTAAGRLLWLVDGTPGVDWQPGGYYEKDRLATSAPVAADDRLCRELWDRSAALVGLEPG